MNATADKKQINGEVKERNRFYRALIQIQTIAGDIAEKDNDKLNSKLEKITGICKESLKNKTGGMNHASNQQI